MNIYILVEGEVVEKKVYAAWVPFANSRLTYTPDINSVNRNNFIIYHGGGYPNYLGMIERAIHDVLNIRTLAGESVFNRLVIAVDSEDMSYESKRNEIDRHIKEYLNKHCVTYFDYKIIVQNFCFETWALGNRKLISKSGGSSDLIEFTKKFNVRHKDPELLLPPDTSLGINRAQYAYKYLRAAILSKTKKSYSKSDPSILLNKKYYDEVLKRLTDTKHIASFNDFITAFNV